MTIFRLINHYKPERRSDLSKSKMKLELHEHQKLATRQILLFVAIATLAFALVSFWSDGVQDNIPLFFGAFSLGTLIILYRFYVHENLVKVFFQGSTISFIVVILINAFSGGIDGVFNFFFAIIVISGYSMKRKYGRFWLVLSILSLIFFYFIDGPLIWGINEISDETRPIFLLFSVCSGLIILGAIYGEYLVRLILEGKVKSSELEIKNQENVVLFKEIHHRVKNNIQVISGLLNLQSHYIDDPKTKEFFRVSQDRIKSMGVVHEMLYEKSNFTDVNVEEYFQRLLNQLLTSMRGENHTIVLHLEVPTLSLNIDTAIPLGLIVNEMVTNSLKHGIPVNQAGNIYLKIQKLDYPNFAMHIGDDGVGLSDTGYLGKSDSLGLKLITNLSHQLQGDVKVESTEKGTKFIIYFKEVNKKT